MEIDSSCKLDKKITEHGLVDFKVNIPLEFFKPLLLCLELEVKFLDAVGQLLIMNFELEFRDLSRIQ
jgi:hypothetical protein